MQSSTIVPRFYLDLIRPSWENVFQFGLSSYFNANITLWTNALCSLLLLLDYFILFCLYLLLIPWIDIYMVFYIVCLCLAALWRATRLWFGSHFSNPTGVLSKFGHVYLLFIMYMYFIFFSICSLPLCLWLFLPCEIINEMNEMKCLGYMDLFGWVILYQWH